MKRIINNIVVLFLCCITFSGCMKEDKNEAIGKLSTFIPVDILKSLHKGSDVVLNENNMTGATSINGVVVSDAAGKNIEPGKVVLQNYGRGIVRGITLLMESGTANLAVGDSVSVNVTGATLSELNGGLVLKGVKETGVKVLASGISVKPVAITIGTLVANFSAYEGVLVKFLGEFDPIPAAGETYEGNKKLLVGVSTDIFLSTLPEAVFANEELPNKAVLVGIPALINTGSGNAFSVAIRNMADVEPITAVTLAAWQFGSPASAGTELSYLATTTDRNLETPALVRGNGYKGSALARGFASNVPVLIKTKEEAISMEGYMEFSVVSKVGFAVSFDNIQARLRRSAAGANNYRWMYKIGGGAFTDAGPGNVLFTSTVDGVDQEPVDLSTVAELQNIPSGTVVTFRLYGWGFGSINAGSFSIGRYAAGDVTNSLSISGTIDRE